MKKLVFLMLICVSFGSLNAQKIASTKIKNDPFYFDNLFLVQDDEKSFIISKHKTTNQEYLCFLMWTYRVFGQDYPEVFEEMLPDTVLYPDIFKPEKSNMPVKGINKKQANAFCQWRSDRLNEFILIREGVLGKDFEQKNERNFNTEFYLSNNYNGLIMRNIFDRRINEIRGVIHSDFMLLPVFYVASKEQLKTCQTLIRTTQIKTAKKVTSDLDWWYSNELDFLFFNSNKNSPFDSYLIKVKSSGLATKKSIQTLLKKYQTELATQLIEFDTINSMYSNKDFRIFNLPDYEAQLRYFKPITSNAANPFVRLTPSSEEGDYFGKMNYVYIADNFDATPICIYKSVFEERNDNNYSGFYCAMNIPYRLLWELQESRFIKYSKNIYRY